MYVEWTRWGYVSWSTEPESIQLTVQFMYVYIAQRDTYEIYVLH